MKSVEAVKQFDRLITEKSYYPLNYHKLRTG